MLRVWAVRVNPNRMDVLKATLDLLRRHGYGMLSTAQIFLERFRRVEFKPSVAHELPRFWKKLFSAIKLEVIDIDAQDDLQLWVEVKAFLSKNTLKTKVKECFRLMRFTIYCGHRMAVETFQ